MDEREGEKNGANPLKRGLTSSLSIPLPGIGQAVDDPILFCMPLDEPGFLQDIQVVRELRVRHADALLDHTDAERLDPKQAEDLNPHRIGQGMVDPAGRFQFLHRRYLAAQSVQASDLLQLEPDLFRDVVPNST